LNVNGGTTPYDFSWSNGDSLQNISDLIAGTYNVSITDFSGCTATTSAVIAQPAAALTISSTVTNVSTNGENDGEIDLTVQGGTPLYFYNWNNGGTSQDISGLTAGIYNVTVTDNNGCDTTHSTLIIQPDSNVVFPLIIGNVRTCLGPPVSFGKVILYDISGGLDTIAIAPIDANGNYRFANITASKLTIQAVPDTNVYWYLLPTYLGGSLLWTESDSITSLDPQPDIIYCQAMPFFCTTSNRGLETFSNFKVFPNPATDKINFQIDSRESQNIKILIHDVSGREVFKSDYTLMAGTNTLEANLSHLTNSVYFLSIKETNGYRHPEVVKFVILH